MGLVNVIGRSTERKNVSSSNGALQAILARCEIKAWSRSKTDKDKTEAVLAEEHAAQDAGRWKKNVMPKSVIGQENLIYAIASVAGKARALHHELSMPWESPWNLLPVKNEPAYRQGMMAARITFNNLVQQLPERWEGYLAKAKEGQGGLYRAEDYPDIESVMRKYFFRYDFSPVPTAGHFVASLAEASMKELREQMEARNTERMQAAQASLIERLVKPLKEFAERLANPDERKFGKTLTMLERVCNEVDNLNSTTGDASITGLVSVTRNLVTALTPDALQDEAIAKSVKETTEKIVAQFGEPYKRRFA